jgi:PAS domain S-box-containing protein
MRRGGVFIAGTWLLRDLAARRLFFLRKADRIGYMQSCDPREMFFVSGILQIGRGTSGMPCIPRDTAKNVRPLRGLLPVLVLFLCCPLHDVHAAASQVVILDSYHHGDTWADAELSGILDVLGRARPDMSPAIEFLDTKRYREQVDLDRQAVFLREKYADDRVAVVLALDDPALELLLAARPPVFPGARVVFCGIDDTALLDRAVEAGCTGVAETLDVHGVMTLILAMLPGVREIYAVSDDTVSGMAMRREAEPVMALFADRVRLEFSPDLSMNRLLERLRALPPDAAVLLLNYVVDGAGVVYSREETTRLISRASPVPVFSLSGLRLGHGIVGGPLISGEDDGRQAGEMAVRLLDGESPDRLPVSHSRSRLLFDHVQLVRFGIGEDRLPVGSAVINRPSSVFARYRWWVLGALALVLAQSALIAVLWERTRRLRRAERALRESEAKYQGYVDNAPMGVIVFDGQGRYLEANPAACRLAGKPAAELLGTAFLDTLAPGSREMVRGHMETLRATGHSQGDVEIEEPSGRRRWFFFSGVSLDRERHLVFVSDVTEKRQAQEGIKAINAGLETKILALTQPMGDTSGLALADIFDLSEVQKVQDAFARAAGVASLVTAPDGAPLTNPSNFCRLCAEVIRGTKKGRENCRRSDAALGCMAGDGPCVRPCLSGGLLDGGTSIRVGEQVVAHWLVGQVLDESADPAAMMAYAREIGADEEAFREALAQVPRMTRRRFEDICQALAVIAGQLSRMAVQNVQQARFITERRAAEESLLTAKAAAEAASRAKSEFLANMSHEIRTPLNGLLGMLQLLQGLPMGGEQQEYVEAALRAGKRLTTLLSDILDLARVESGKMELAREPFDFTAAAKGVFGVLSPAFREKKLDLSLEIAPSVPGRLLGDEIRVRQILFNLVGNAIKFTPSGSVRLSAWAVPAASPDAVTLVFEVADTGIGIPEEKIDSVFESFSQVEGAYTRQYQGAGLGLAIVKRLVSLMGGTLLVESGPGRGAVVSCALPLGLPQARRPDEPGRDGVAARPLAPGARVVLAEDDAVNRIAAREMLRKLGLVVLEAENGRDCLRLIEDDAAGLVRLALMDIQMPVLDGLEAARAIREREARLSLPRLPLVALTAYAMPGERRRFLLSGFDACLAKPVDSRMLAEVLGKFVPGEAGEKT